MDKVKLGIIGLGNIGTLHLDNLRAGRVPEVELSAVCDIDPKRLQWAETELGDSVQRFPDAQAMIDAGVVDAVLICTPHYDHPPLAIAAFDKGLHVLTEKPAGVYTRQVREMNEAAAASGKVFGIMFQMRTTGVYRKLKELIDSGEVGPIRRITWICTSWYRSESYYRSGGWRATWAGEGGGVLMNQCPHNLDMWQYLFGLPKRLRAACAFGKYHDIEVEDEVTAYMEYENGATATFITTTAEAPGSDRLEVACDNGLLTLGNDEIIYQRNRVATSRHLVEATGTFGKPEHWTCRIEAPTRLAAGQPHADILQNFARAVLKGEPLLAPGEDGIRGLELANAMLLSAWNDEQWVTLPVDEDAFHATLQERIKTSTYVKKTDGDGPAADMDASFHA